MAITEDTLLIRQAMAYVIELYREMTAENGAPTLGTQNQVVDFILAEPALRRAVSDWARALNIDEATTSEDSLAARRYLSVYQCLSAICYGTISVPAPGPISRRSPLIFRTR